MHLRFAVIITLLSIYC